MKFNLFRAGFLSIALVFLASTLVAKSSCIDHLVKVVDDKGSLALQVEKVVEYIESLKSENLPYLEVKEVDTSYGWPIYRILIRDQGAKDPMKVLLTAGVHGDEPMSVKTIARLIEKAKRDPKFRKKFDFTIFPMMNPEGLHRNQRKLPSDVDLNRTVKEGHWVKESMLFAREIEGHDFFLADDLHGAPLAAEFFLIRGKEDSGMSRRILRALPKGDLLSSMDGNYPGRPIPESVFLLDGPGEATSTNPQTFKGYMILQGTPYSYTQEYAGEVDPRKKDLLNFRLLLSVLFNVKKHGLR